MQTNLFFNVITTIRFNLIVSSVIKLPTVPEKTVIKMFGAFSTLGQ